MFKIHQCTLSLLDAYFHVKFLNVGDNLRIALQPQVPSAQTNNHQPSGFKRQNTVDSATIKENSARINARPASAQPKTNTENSKFRKKLIQSLLSNLYFA